MPLRLRVLPPDGPERAVEIDDGVEEIRLGRRPDLEVELPFATLSALHARIVRGDGRWTVEDLGSHNGTVVGGERLEPRRPRPVEPGARIELGDLVVIFDGPSPAAPDAAGTGTIARRLVSDLFAAAPGTPVPALEQLSGGARLGLRAADRAYVVGRAPDCDLPLATDQVSREHASFTRRADGVFVRDLGSKNGVRLGGARIDGEARLRDGDVVEVGPVALRLDDPEDRYLREMETPAEPPVATRPEAPVPADVVVARRSTARLSTIVAAAVLIAAATAAVLLALTAG
jgi:pSer/pThr/pTyr-binding forkhead associated (FHA) protein